MPRVRQLVARFKRRHNVPEIAYAPERDGDPDPGEVVWAWVPYEDDATQGTDRPDAVVAQVRRLNRWIR